MIDISMIELMCRVSWCLPVSGKLLVWSCFKELICTCLFNGHCWACLKNLALVFLHDDQVLAFDVICLFELELIRSRKHVYHLNSFEYVISWSMIDAMILAFQICQKMIHEDVLFFCKLLEFCWHMHVWLNSDFDACWIFISGL